MAGEAALHIPLCLFEKLALLALVVLALSLLLLLELLFPFLAFLLATITARQVVKLFSVGDLKLVSSSLTLESNLAVEETVYHLDLMLGGDILAASEEALTLVAPLIATGVAIKLAARLGGDIDLRGARV